MALPLNHIRTGSGPPLLLVHGLGGTIAIWEPILDALAATREVVAVDMPGFGHSPSLPAGSEATAENLCAAVVDFYDTLGLDPRPQVCGNSLGGWVAIECGRNGRASAVTGLNTAGFWPRPLGGGPRNSPARAAARTLGPFAGLLMANESVRTKVLGGQIRHPERVTRRQAAELIRGYGRGDGYDEANTAMRAGTVGDLSGFNLPLTLGWGEYDRLVRNRPLPRERVPPQTRQFVIPDAGHVPTWDQPELVTELILTTAEASVTAA
jgi:pimeloyl-ACP methyl ester carboxylesterase